MTNRGETTIDQRYSNERFKKKSSVNQSRIFPTQRLGYILFLVVCTYFGLLWSTLRIHSRLIPSISPGVRGFDGFIGDFHRSGIINRGASKTNTTTDNINPSIITIGIASTITGCGGHFAEGAAILKYSIDQTSISGPKGGKYNYKMYILHHPDTLECSLPLQDLGFELIERPTPVNVSDIQGEILRDRIAMNGCCGEKELIKLEVFRLTQHPIVIHLDLDVLVMQPMDPLIDLMLDPQQKNKTEHSDLLQSFLMWPGRPIPETIDLMFTVDYNVVAPRRDDKPYQGGFFAIKPSMKTYQDFIDIVRVGDYRDGKKNGWGGIVGPFYGGMTIQGLLPWYYRYIHPGTSVELNRCVFNNMADNPTTDVSINDIPQGKCRSNEETCQDCRNQSLKDIVTFHYTICLKPWNCLNHDLNSIDHRLCQQVHHEWFRYRYDLERSWGRNGTGIYNYRTDRNYGNCKFAGLKGYYPIQTPYGKS